MPQARRAIKSWTDFNIPVSYRVNEIGDKLRDASNVFTLQGRLATRNGLSRFNGTVIDSANNTNSISFFQETDGTNHYIVKAGTNLYDVKASGAATRLDVTIDQADVDVKHRGVTLNNRHIISLGTTGLFSWDGTTLSSLGQDYPRMHIVFDKSIFSTTGPGLENGTTWGFRVSYYDSTNGFESNSFSLSSYKDVTWSDGKGINLDWSASSPSVVAQITNSFVDKLRIYASSGSGEPYYFVEDIDIDSLEYDFRAAPTSTQTPPIKQAPPLDGGGKFLTDYNGKLVYSGNNEYKNDVFFSEQYQPDAFDDSGLTQTVLNISGDGFITGLATGLYSNSVLDPYLVVFKKTSTHIYSEIRGEARQYELNSKIGCVSHETIEVINGNVYFMSANGWAVIIDGRLITDQKGNPYTLGQGDIDDIFIEKGYAYEIDKSYSNTFHSVYYQQLDQYITFVTQEGALSNRRAYVYEHDSKGFKPYDFNLNIVASVACQDSVGDDIVMLADDEGYLYTHSIKELKTDVDKDGNDVLINAFVYLNWTSGGDDDASYNFRELILKAIADDDVIVKTWIDYTIINTQTQTYEFSGTSAGFQLDVSQLDVDSMSDGRAITRLRGDINRVGKSILISFSQKIANGDIKIFSAQLNMSKNGNPN